MPERPPKKKTGRPELGAAGMTGRIALRVFAEDIEQIAALVKSFEGFDSPTIVRTALRLGLTLLEIDPSLLVVGAATSAKRQQELKARLHKKP